MLCWLPASPINKRQSSWHPPGPGQWFCAELAAGLHSFRPREDEEPLYRLRWRASGTLSDVDAVRPAAPDTVTNPAPRRHDGLTSHSRLPRGSTHQTGASGLLRPRTDRHAGQRPLSCKQDLSMEDGRPPCPSLRLQHRSSPPVWRGAAGHSTSRVRESSIWTTPVGSSLCPLGCRRGSTNPRVATKRDLMRVQICDGRSTPTTAGHAHLTGEAGPASQQYWRLLLTASVPDVQLEPSLGHGAGRWWGSGPWSGAGSPHAQWPGGQHPAGPQRKLRGLPALVAAAHLLAADQISHSRLQLAA